VRSRGYLLEPQSEEESAGPAGELGHDGDMSAGRVAAATDLPA
jgi:hypothetical protein